MDHQYAPNTREDAINPVHRRDEEYNIVVGSIKDKLLTLIDWTG